MATKEKKPAINGQTPLTCPLRLECVNQTISNQDSQELSASSDSPFLIYVGNGNETIEADMNKTSKEATIETTADAILNTTEPQKFENHCSPPDQSQLLNIGIDIHHNCPEVKAMTSFKKALKDTLLEDEFKGELVIYVVGKTGQGKSTLINSIIELEYEIAQEGASTNICTTTVQSYFYSNVVPGVTVTIVDTPGLQDIHQNEQTYIQLMKEKCPELHLIFYCIKMTDRRVTSDDKIAMQKLYHAFGPRFWERVVIVFTYSNCERCDLKDDRDDNIPELSFKYKDKEERKKIKNRRFANRLQLRIKETKIFLKETIGLDNALVDKIRFIPSGYYREDDLTPNPYQLYGIDNWLYDLLKLCCTEIKTTHMFSKINLNNKIRLAIIIANDIEDSQSLDSEKIVSKNEDESDESVTNDGSDNNLESMSFVQADQHTSDTELVNCNSVLVKSILQKLGFCVLYLKNLSSNCIHKLLKTFQNIDKSQIAMFSLVIFSKGKSPNIFGSDKQLVSFEDIFNNFPQKQPISPGPVNIFFFHLSLTKPHKKSFALFPGPPSNSVALAVMSTDQNVHSVASPAVKCFVDVLTSSSYIYPVKQCFQKVKEVLIQNHFTCDCIDTLNENFVFSTICEPSSVSKNSIVLLEKQLKVYRDLWSIIRDNTIDELISSKDEVIQIIHNERIARIAVASTSLAIGGTLAIAGLALVPVTLGASISITAASIGFSVAGLAVGGVASLGNIGAFIASKMLSSKLLKNVQKHIQLDQQVSISLNKITWECMQAKMATPQKVISSAVMSQTSQTSQFGVTIDSHDVIEGSAVAAHTMTLATGIVSVPLDLFFIIYYSHHFYKSSIDKSGGKTESRKIVKWFVNQIEDTLKSKSYFTDVIAHKLESIGVRAAVYENKDSGYVLQVPSTCTKELSTITVSTILSGPFSFPEGTALVSAIYDVKIEEVFDKPFFMEVKHCVGESGLSKLHFAKATVNFETKAFEFTILPDEKFSIVHQDTSFASIDIKESCMICVLYEGPLKIDTLKYSAHYFTTMGTATSFWNMSISFSKNLPIFSKYISIKSCADVQSCEFKFTSLTETTFSPCLKITNFTEIGGWKISTRSDNEVSKNDIDNIGHNEHMNLPTFDLDLQRCDDTAIVALEFDIQIQGTNLLVPIRINASFN